MYKYSWGSSMRRIDLLETLQYMQLYGYLKESDKQEEQIGVSTRLFKQELWQEGDETVLGSSEKYKETIVMRQMTWLEICAIVVLRACSQFPTLGRNNLIHCFS